MLPPRVWKPFPWGPSRPGAPRKVYECKRLITTISFSIAWRNCGQTFARTVAYSHFFNSASQFAISVIGSGVEGCKRLLSSKRCPSVDTSNVQCGEGRVCT